MRGVVLGLTVGAWLLGASPSWASPSGGGRSNFVVILLDDAGWRDVGFAGNEYIETPHMDRLARDGARFTRAYATHPFCTPTRQSMVTGQWPARTAWKQRSEVADPDAPRSAPPYAAAGSVAWTEREARFTSLAEALRGAGYATGHIGKSHLHTIDAPPEELGFDYFVGGAPNVGAVEDYYPPYPRLPGEIEAREDEYLTRTLTRETIEFIERNRDTPFFVQLWHYAPHTPIQAPEEETERYREKRRRMGDPSLNPTYAAMLDVVDQGVGRIMKRLEELGLAGETVVLLTSDNGGVRRLGSVPVTSMDPLRGDKGRVYEGGVRVPMAIRWPRSGAGGAVADEPVSVMDFYPTILDLAGVALPEGPPVDGTSLVPLLRGEAAPSLKERPLFWHNVTSGVTARGETFQPVAAVRRGKWKLIHYFGRSPDLYDLSEDPGETNNLAEARPGVASELKRRIGGWLEATGVVPPTPNPRHDPDYEPPRQVEAVPEGYEKVREWRLASAGERWRAVRAIETTVVGGALRMRSAGLYPVVRSPSLGGLPPGRYAVRLELRVPTSGRVRLAWRGGGDKGTIEFFPERDGEWHTLVGVFEARAPIEAFRFAAPTHLRVTGHYDPKAQPDFIEARSIELWAAPGDAPPEDGEKATPSAAGPGASTQGAVFTDGFGRAAAESVRGERLGPIGPGWRSSGSGSWSLRDGRLHSKRGGGEPSAIAHHENAATKPPFELRGSVTLPTSAGTAYAGVVCHDQNADEAYVFRYNGRGRVQFLAEPDAAPLLNRPDAFAHEPGDTYRLTVRASRRGRFALRVEAADSGETLFEEAASDPKRRYSGGHAGFVNAAREATFDDLVLK